MKYSKEYIEEMIKADIKLKEEDIKRVLENKDYDELLKDLKIKILKSEIEQLNERLKGLK